MSLANIENRLTPEEMENVMAGSTLGCSGMSIGASMIVLGAIGFGSVSLLYGVGSYLYCNYGPGSQP
ncbi:MAG TPA: hypothetical protein VN182_00610 [Flavobacterium sp.]|nr:hypothetical protein [Flavobacterium sp.]